MKEIVLEECFDEKGTYLGNIVIKVEDLTPEFLKKIKEDTGNNLGWMKYRKVMKDNGIDVETAVQ
jgi:hypothetical protein